MPKGLTRVYAMVDRPRGRLTDIVYHAGNGAVRNRTVDTDLLQEVGIQPVKFSFLRTHMWAGSPVEPCKPESNQVVYDALFNYIDSD